jgi:hypothetical protein
MKGDIGKDLEGSDRGLIEAMFRRLPGGEENHTISQSGLGWDEQ